MQHLNAANDFSMCLKEKYILHVALLFQSLCWIYDIQQFLAFFSTIAVPCKEYFANYWGCLLQRFNLIRASRFSGVSENGVIGSPSKIYVQKSYDANSRYGGYCIKDYIRLVNRGL